MAIPHWLGGMGIRRIPRFRHRPARRRAELRKVRPIAEVLEDRTLLASATLTGQFLADARMIGGGNSTKNYGTSTLLRADGSPDTSALFKFDVSAIPLGSSIQTVEFTVNVTSATDDTYEIFQLLRPWDETAVTFNLATAITSWQTAGAAGSSDRGSTILGTMTASANGLRTVALNAAGIAVVQSWVNNPGTNQGLIIQDYTGATDSLDFDSREATTAANRPTFRVVYNTATGASNVAPSVNAGPDKALNAAQILILDGTVTDDGLPNPPGTITAIWSVPSGPGVVTFGDPNAIDNWAQFSAAGTYVLRLTASDGALSSSDTVTVVVSPAPPNVAPSVSPGPDRIITLGQAATLSGSVTDDGYPNPPGAVTSTWSKSSGPGTVTFANAAAAATTATFSTAGTYVLRLTASDGALSSSATMTVVVNTPPNAAPTVSAGPDRSINFGQSATLSGTVSDDGFPNPPAAVTSTWSKASGPGTVTFANASSAATTATFSASGTYILRLTADDGGLSSSATMTVTVNLAPTVSAGPDRSINFGQSATLSGTVSDDGFPNPPAAVTSTWSKSSGPGTVTFANASSSATTATFSVAGTYVLQLTGSDSALASSDTMTVFVNSAPTVSAGPDRTITLGQSATLSGTVSDDGLPNPPAAVTSTWSKSSGPGTVTFANASSSATTATFSVAGTYVLQLTGSDSALASSDTMTVFVNSAPTVSAGPDRTINFGQSATLSGSVSDDGLPNPPAAVTSTWSKSSGPGTVTFANASSSATTATFSVAGTYVLQLTSSDSALASSDTMTVFVNSAPTVSAGPDRTITLGQFATLSGSATDDGLPNPPNALTLAWTKSSGPGTVSFANSAAAATTATFSLAGTYVLQLTANDGSLASTDTMTVTVNAPVTNTAPTVSAGPDQSINFGQSATLSGLASDDGLPNPPNAVTLAWTKSTGPGTVSFANAAAAATTATFSVAGTYVLQLTANDGSLASSDTMTVTVNAPVTNSAPTVSAGPDRTITLGQSATLSGSATDDGLPNPPNAVTLAWTKSSGPGTVSFANSAAAATTATFSVAGTYVLQLTANDGSLASSSTMTVTVNTPVTNTAPTVSAGPDRTITLGQSATLSGSASDDGLPNPPNALTLAWTKSSGPGTVSFVNAAAAATTATFSVTGTYVLQLTANDGSLASSSTMTVTVNAPATNTAPTVSAGPDRTISLGQTAVLSGTANDDGLPNPPNALTLAWTKSSGPGTVSFVNAAAAATTATFSVEGTYVLQLLANDGSLSSSDTMTVTVNASASTGTVWISQAEIMSLPTTGTAWNTLASAAAGSIGTPDIADQNDSSEQTALAKALVGVRTNNQTYVSQARSAVLAAIGTELGGETLAAGRNIAAWVITAQIVGLSPTEDAQFRAWLQFLLTENLSGKTLQSTHEVRPNNWGTMSGASRAAIAVYLGDQAELARAAQIFKGWVGDRASYTGFSFGDLSWQADPTKPVAINPVGAVKEGHSIDGALPDEMRRGGSFAWPPAQTSYPWEALQGAFVQAEILYRSGYDVYNWESQALKRSVQFLYDLGWNAAGDDRWLPFIVNARYGTTFSTDASASPGKIMGWTQWTHAAGAAALQLAPTPGGETTSAPSPSIVSPSIVAAADLDPVVNEAVDRLAQALGTQVRDALRNVRVVAGDLGFGMLGSAVGDTIIIDRDAAGAGWFIDCTLTDDAEFALRAGTSEFAATVGSEALGRVDLLTVVMHEMGHVLGFVHADDSADVMYETLAVGTRRTAFDHPSADAGQTHDQGFNALDDVFLSFDGDLT